MGERTERVIDPTDAAAEPWRNGLGITRTLVSGDAWRLSLATVDADCRFSVFDGIDRVIVPLGEHPLTLVVDGERRVIPAVTASAFRGESSTVAVDVVRRTHVINLMIHRRAATARLVVVGPSQPMPARSDLLVVLDGTARVAGRALRPGSVLLHPRRDTAVLRTAGVLGCVSVRPRP